MRSIYIKILLWCLGSLAICIAAWGLVTSYVFYQMVGQDSFFERMNTLQLEEAIAMYESSGSEQLAKHFDRANTLLGGRRYLTDSRGKDLITGADHSELLSHFQNHTGVFQTHGDQIAVAVASPDTRYTLLVVADSPFQMRPYILYYVPILLILAASCLFLAWRIASPLRSMVNTLDRFGRGDLDARVNSRRRDEIGELGTAFDRMAERISTLRASERRLLQDVSHELRSPLARLSFAAELAATTENRDAVARLKKEIQRLTALVEGLLQTLNPESETPAMAETAVELSTWISEIVDDCRLEAEARRCDIVLDGVATTIRVEPELLRRAVENVIRNAIRYSPENSRIEVDYHSEDHMMQISVRDQGPGVPEEALDKIFKPFFRVDDSRNRSTGGAGLGLAIAHRSISLHNGRIWARNADPGLLVTIELPMPVYKT